MKRKIRLSFYYITFLVFCLVGSGAPAMAKDVNNFYFESFLGDYYLSKDEEGVSRLKVKEEVTAVFPDYNQNKGICRQIAYTNQGGVNTTLQNLSRTNLTLTRNGVSEPIYSIEKENGYYNVCTGDESYVTGRQVYVFEYEFVRVVTEFDGYQELYWDTNGNGATQRFDKVTARVHFDPEVYAGENWCYVGRYGETGEGRCVATATRDGVEFTAKNLSAYENLTFDLLLKPGAFVVPEPDKSYVAVILAGMVVVACGLLLIFPIRKFLRTREKRQYYKGLFVKPEYQPHEKYGLSEMVTIWMGKKKNEKVAVLLDMIVQKKIAIYKVREKKRGKQQWGIRVLKLDAMTPEEVDLIRILKGGGTVGAKDDFEVKKHTATSSLVELGRKFDSATVSQVKADGLATEKFTVNSKTASVAGTVFGVWIPLMIVIAVAAVVTWDRGMLNLNLNGLGKEIILAKESVIVAVVTVVATITVWAVLSGVSRRYEVRTKEGLLASRYMDGLKLYIEMAEAERMKVLQSVEGADTSAEGVVRLYEKLLPYAAVFGLEESWMNELSKYYEMAEVTEPDWYRSGITPTDMIAMSHLMSDYSRMATVMASSSGSSSSGGSGSFGGGFSGGGGGGGGFSGR